MSRFRVNGFPFQSFMVALATAREAANLTRTTIVIVALTRDGAVAFEHPVHPEAA